MNKPAYERLPRDLKTVLDTNSDQLAAGMAGAMWDFKPMPSPRMSPRPAM